ncbi:MAG TPA: CRISPR system precrRNA processing endoribonuclease RAMP protein Cas6 [Anaerolineae bacterium]|nr:CRISPR system precrRNA processing endoribonuclease RAMP protein Cas6 [Anaerolineae bacterium]HQH38447.1 CRISPR system precrRNA processing endoribonuclease RAMP protein Cas6 [Anaerolineae bacterium]
MDLLSLVLTLRPTTAAALPPRLGRAAHAILLAHIAEHDPALAEALHAEDSLRPITASELIGGRVEDQRVSPERLYTLRYTALTAETSAALCAAFAPGDTLTFEDVDFIVETIEPLADSASEIENQKSRENHLSPWAGNDDYPSLAARHLLPAAPPSAARWTFVLASPTAFRSQGQTQPLPLPGLFFGSLVKRWNAFAPVALPEEGIKHYAEEMTVVSRFSLRSAPGWDRGRGDRRGLRIGSIGKITYTALNRDRYWLSAFDLLAEFALYAGAGAQTTMGMGQVRAIQRDEV